VGKGKLELKKSGATFEGSWNNGQLQEGSMKIPALLEYKGKFENNRFDGKDCELKNLKYGYEYNGNFSNGY